MKKLSNCCNRRCLVEKMEDTAVVAVAGPSTAPVEAPSTAPAEVPSAVPAEAPSAAPAEVPSSTPADAPSAVPVDEEDDTEAPIPEVEALIEGLNSAIDNVNVLEDGAQACRARHAAISTALHCQASALAAEGAPYTAAAFEAGSATMRARRQQVVAEQALAGLQTEQAQLQAESQLPAGSWALTSSLSATKQRIAAATKALNAARKASGNAAAREDKARKALQKAHALEVSRLPPMVTFPANLVAPTTPLDEELGILLRRLALSAEADAAAAAESSELAELERQKDEAATAVSDAMLALEEMSNTIHANRMAAAAMAVEADGGDIDTPGVGHGSSAESGGDSDFVCEDDDDEGDTPGGRTPRGARTPKRERQDDGAPFSSGGGDEAELSNMQLATRTAVARLLRKASELVSVTSPTPSQVKAAPPPWHGHQVESVWYGVAWNDGASTARLQAEFCTAITQSI